MGRICVILPILLTLGSLISLALVFVGNTTAPTSLPHSLYFLNITTTNFQFRSQLHTKDWYTVGLWNYCSGLKNSTSPTYCSPRQSFYHFDPLAAWGITGSIFENAVPANWRSGLDAYYKTSHYMWWAYICAIATTGLTFVLSFTTCFCGRLGSFLTTAAAWVAMAFTVAASILATALFLMLRAFVAERLGGYSVSSRLGHAMFVVTWIATAFSVAAALTWVINLCCCGGGYGCCGCCGVDDDDKETGKRAVGRGTVYVRVPNPAIGGRGEGGGGARKNMWYGQKSKDVQLATRPANAKEWRYESFKD